MWNDISRLTKHERSLEEDAKLSHELPCLAASDELSQKHYFNYTNDVSNMDCQLEDHEEENVFEKKDNQILGFHEEAVEQISEEAVEEIKTSDLIPPSHVNFSCTSETAKDISSNRKKIPSSKKKQKKLTRNLPLWVWKIIEKTLGIPREPRESPWLATTIHILTFGSALTYIASYSWFVVYDISSMQTKRDALNGIVSMVIATFWSSLAVYANHLAYRMFRHKVFAKNVKLHSKTVLKCNGAILLIFCGLLFIVLSDYAALQEFSSDTCEIIELEHIVCETVLLSRVIFSVFAFLWNMLIALVMMAVCRTHTLDIRQFINYLYEDAVNYDRVFCKQYGIKSSILFNKLSVRDYIANPRQGERYSLFEDYDSDNEILENKDEILPSLNQASMQVANSNVFMTRQTIINQPNCSENQITEGDVHGEESPKDFSINIEPLDPHNLHGEQQTGNGYLTQSQILHHYWKLQCQIWMSSSMLQRWMVCFICLCVIWIGVTLVHWLSNSPTVLGVVLFIIPLIMLPVLCSAYAEVNNEGQRMIRSVSPSEDRLWMLFYLHQAPLQMTMYGFPIRYSTVVTTMFGLVAALASGIVLQEIKAL